MSVVNKTNNLIRKKYKLRPRRNLFNLGNLYHRSIIACFISVLVDTNDH